MYIFLKDRDDLFFFKHPFDFYFAFFPPEARPPSSSSCRLWVALDAACGLSHMHNSTPKVAESESDPLSVVVRRNVQPGKSTTPTWNIIPVSKWLITMVSKSRK